MPIVDTTKIEPVAMHMIWAINQAGYEARICGGAVRDIIMGRVPKDWDIATTALPEQVVDIMDANDIKTIPTGLQHGTITAVRAGVAGEITTLRIDTETDGRHAEVEFTDDWKLDSDRRDFTINAMYIDEDGLLYDYHGGMEDISACNRSGPPAIIFVGDPATRIQEDYLRILRYFRFSAQLDSRIGVREFVYSLQLYRGILHAFCYKLSTLSGERVWSELAKICQQPNYKVVCKEMASLGIFDVLSIPYDSNSLSVGNNRDVPPAVRLGGLVEQCKYETFLDIMKNKFHCSNAEMAPIQFAWDKRGVEMTKANIRKLLAQYPNEYVLAWILICGPWWVTDEDHYTSPERLYYAFDLVVPEFPITGRDLIDLGYAKGPQLGKTLHALKMEWADMNFAHSKDDLLRIAKRSMNLH